MVSTLMVVYLEEGAQSGSPRWCTWTWREKDGLPGARRLVSTLMVAYLEQAGLVIILMVVYLEQGGQSGSWRWCP